MFEKLQLSRKVSRSRREVLQVGCSTLMGLGLSSLMARTSTATSATSPTLAKVRSVVFIFLPGGPSHIDSFDPKPDAPAEVRGTFKTIDTAVPGVQICEHLPGLAQRMQRLTILRTMRHSLSHHDAVCFLPCGIDAVPAGFKGSASRADWPCYAAGLDKLKPRTDGIPSGVSLPLVLKNGPTPVSGIHAGFLGPRHDPMQVDHDPNDGEFSIEGLSLPSDILTQRFDARQHLLQLVDRFEEKDSPASDPYRVYRERAGALLASGEFGAAFDLAKESAPTRDRYGRNSYGQSILLARRLVEAGVPMIQANLGVATEWDTHYDNAGPMRKKLLPRLDQSVSALIDDLADRRLLDETLIVIAGEFGRTPKIGDFQDGKFWPDGRGHWSNCFSVVFAGGGIHGGQVIGASDKIGAYPVTAEYHPSDLGATVYTLLGVDPTSMIHDVTGRPARLCEGTFIEPLFRG